MRHELHGKFIGVAQRAWPLILLLVCCYFITNALCCRVFSEGGQNRIGGVDSERLDVSGNKPGSFQTTVSAGGADRNITLAQSDTGTKAISNLNNIIYAAMESGSDGGAKLAACLAAASSTSGVCDASGLAGAQSATSTITISQSNIHLSLSPDSTWTLSGNPGIQISGRDDEIDCYGATLLSPLNQAGITVRLSDASHVKLDNCVVSANYTTGSVTSVDLDINNSSEIWVEHTVFMPSGYQWLLVENASHDVHVFGDRFDDSGVSRSIASDCLMVSPQNSTTDVYNVWIERNTFSHNGDDVIAVNTLNSSHLVHDVHIVNNSISQGGNATCVDLVGGYNLWVEGNNCTDSGAPDGAIQLWANYSSSDGADVYNVWIEHNSITETQGGSYAIDEAVNGAPNPNHQNNPIIIRDNYISANGTTGTGGGLLAKGYDNLIVANTITTGSTNRACIYANGLTSSTSGGNIIAQNTFYDCYAGVDFASTTTVGGLTVSNNQAISTSMGDVSAWPTGMTYIGTDSFNFSSLPACSASLKNVTANVADSNTTTWGATVVGGASYRVLAFCDGTNWKVTAR